MSADAIAAPPRLADLVPLLPPIILAGWGLLILVADFVLVRASRSGGRRPVLAIVSFVGLGLALISCFLPHVLGTTDGEPSLLRGVVAGGPLIEGMDALIVLLLGLVLGLAMVGTDHRNRAEAFALMFWAGGGMMVLVAAEELVTLFLSLETMTICLYLLAAFEPTGRRSSEAGLKYFIYGSVSSALFLFGLSLLVGLTGTTRMAEIGRALQDYQAVGGVTGDLAGWLTVLLVLVGFGFKIAATPFHQWAPDAYEGAPESASAWIASGSKVASVIAFLKLLVQTLGPGPGHNPSPVGPDWVILLAILAAASMVYGNVAALGQTRLKRLLAYSSIGQTGYLLVGVIAALVSVTPGQAIGSLLLYLAGYAFATVGGFATAAWLVRDSRSDAIDALDGLGGRSPLLAGALVLTMLSLIGLPPTAGFVGKLFMFMEALETPPRYRLTLIWLVLVGLLMTIVSAFYYARIIRAVCFRAGRATSLSPAPQPVAAALLVSAAVAVGVGLAARPILHYTKALGQSRQFMVGGGLGPARPVVSSPPR